LVNTLDVLNTKDEPPKIENLDFIEKTYNYENGEGNRKLLPGSAFVIIPQRYRSSK